MPSAKRCRVTQITIWTCLPRWYAPAIVRNLDSLAISATNTSMMPQSKPIFQERMMTKLFSATLFFLLTLPATMAYGRNVLLDDQMAPQNGKPQLKSTVPDVPEIAERINEVVVNVRSTSPS